ncbi:hypothetical protein AB1Y20_012898 [Prymnesium parvum]
MTENIQVLVRVRPLNEAERARGDHECIHVTDDCRTVQFVAPVAPDRRGAKSVVKALTFDGALCGSQQSEVFRASKITQLLRDALEGYAVTILAYGQTGSGKTFTMTGPESLDYSDAEQAPLPGEHGAAGLIPRALGELFTMLGTPSHSHFVRASYLELYNEAINDLLNPESTNLQLRWQAKTGVFVENLLQVDCEGVADAIAVFAEGTRNRKVGSHLLNKDSSRSHCIMTLYLPRKDLRGAEGRICFVDLAGSERLMETHTTGEALKETSHINKSLFVLGNVISALADPRKRAGHIPYRDSKLTRLLMDSLGGEGRTLMLACCSPSSLYLDETLNTLHFASRAKNVQNRPVVPQPAVDTQAMLIQQLQATLVSLQEENACLKLRNDARASEPAASSTHTGSSSMSAGSEIAALLADVRQLRTSNELIQRSHDALLRENQQLKTKLERLEKVFYHSEEK